MQVLRSKLAIGFVVVVAACGGGPGTTQGPDGGGGGDTPAPQVTSGPVETQSGDGGVLPGNGSGKVTYEISGPVQKTGELPFFGVGSRFSGPAGAHYAFTRTDGSSTEIVSIFPDAADTTRWLVSYVAEDFQVSATGCDLSNWQTSDTSASGTFDCRNAIVTKPDGAYLTDGRITGTFDARP